MVPGTEILKLPMSIIVTSQKDLLTRAMGRFYTHLLIGKQLTRDILAAISLEKRSNIRIIDPFCGDGRLLCWLIEDLVASDIMSSSQSLYVELWDIDETALHKALNSVTCLGNKLNISLSIHHRLVNTFEIALDYLGKFDIVITNPPWEVLKPDHRELKKLETEEKQQYIGWLKRQDQILEALYPLSQPQRKFSGWGTNLARCGTEVALRLTSSQGVCGLVSPASLLADQLTEKLRQWILQEYVIHNLAFYPAEARLFKGVDQSAITLIASPGQTKKFNPVLTVYSRNHEVQSKSRFYISLDSLKKNNYILPVHFGSAQIQMFDSWADLPMFGDLEGKVKNGLWAGRELDETGYQNYLCNKGHYLFLKGRMIQRFGIAEPPEMFVREDGPKIPKSADFHRIAWRDVSRPSQKRRLQATLIPPQWVTGNSLHVTYFRDQDLNRLKALLALMNSFVFEFQLRAYLATSHVSLSSIRRVRLPDLTNRNLIETLSSLVDKCMEGCETAETEIEIQVAQAYGLSQREFKLLLSAFEKLTVKEIGELIPINDKNPQSLHA